MVKNLLDEDGMKSILACCDGNEESVLNEILKALASGASKFEEAFMNFLEPTKFRALKQKFREAKTHTQDVDFDERLHEFDLQYNVQVVFGEAGEGFTQTITDWLDDEEPFNQHANMRFLIKYFKFNYIEAFDFMLTNINQLRKNKKRQLILSILQLLHLGDEKKILAAYASFQAKLVTQGFGFEGVVIGKPRLPN